MLRHLLLIVFFISCTVKGYEWKNVIISGRDTVEISKGDNLFIKSGAGHGWEDTLNHISYLELLNDTIPDSIHYFFTQYIRLKNRHVSDSNNIWYFKLIKK